MHCRPDRDRLAVWTYEEAGEQIPNGDPSVTDAVAALSAGVVPRQISGAARSARIPHYLAAGTLEPSFRRSTRQWAERLAKAGLPGRHEEWIGGHDQKWWEQQLPVALGWLLRA